MSPPDPYQPPRPVETPTRTGLSILALVLLLAAILGPLLGCATAQQDMRRLCVAADAAGRMLTISGTALRTVHDLDVDAAWQSQCSSGTVEEKVICRHRVVDDYAAKYRDRYATAAQAVEAQHALADALEETGICKEPAK